MSHLLIVGGTKGLGRAFAGSLGNDYDQVSVIARSEPKDWPDGTRRLRFVAADVTDSASLRAGLQQVVAEGGPLSHLVCFQQYRAKEDLWHGKLACILTATRDILEFCRDHLAPTGDKSIVLLASIASQKVAPEQDEGYHAAKTGLLGLARYYACQLGPLGVRVNCVSPGTVLKAASQHYFLANPELHDWFRQIIPLRRMGTEKEVAATIKFLLSDAASFITGQELVIDGGAGLVSQESLARELFQRRLPAGATATPLPPRSTTPSA